MLLAFLLLVLMFVALVLIDTLWPAPD